MNEIINKFSSTGDILLPEMHLRQSGFTSSACGLFTKNKERKQKFEETGESRYIYQYKLNKVCFQHKRAYGGFRDLPRKTAYNKVLHDKTFNIAKNPKYDEYQCRLPGLVYNFFDKNPSVANILDGVVTRAWSETVAMQDKYPIKRNLN